MSCEILRWLKRVLGAMGRNYIACSPAHLRYLFWCAKVKFNGCKSLFKT